MNRAFARSYDATKEKEPPPEPDLVLNSDEMELAQSILIMIESKDFFSVFGLPKPRMNALDKPVWDVTDSELSRAFRKKSLRIHPDKNPDPDARKAFDALNEVYQALQDPIKRGEWVREAAERSKRLEKNSWNPSNDVSKDLEAVSAFEKEKRELKKEEADSFAAEIAKQMKTKRMRAQYKTACVKASRMNAHESDSDSEEEPEKPAISEDPKDNSDEEREAKRLARAKNAKRKKPKFIM